MATSSTAWHLSFDAGWYPTSESIAAFKGYLFPISRVHYLLYLPGMIFTRANWSTVKVTNGRNGKTIGMHDILLPRHVRWSLLVKSYREPLPSRTRDAIAFDWQKSINKSMLFICIILTLARERRFHFPRCQVNFMPGTYLSVCQSWWLVACRSLHDYNLSGCDEYFIGG